MDAFRYGLALVILCTVPSMLLWWPVVHGGIHLWRRLGSATTYAVVLGGAVLSVVAVAQARAVLLSVQFGTRWPLVAAGVGCLMVAAWFRAVLHRDVSGTLFLGLPELDPSRHLQGLVRTGGYARIRHPRYLQLWLVLLGYALVANYLATYAIWLLWVPAAYVTTWFEERELRERFGDEYARYCQQVPRFGGRRHAPFS